MRSVVLLLLTSLLLAAPACRTVGSAGVLKSDEDARLGALACEAGRAYAAKDFASLDSLTAPDYVQTDVRGGVLDAAAWRAFVRGRPSVIGVACDSVTVRHYAGAAIVLGRWTYTRQDSGRTVIAQISRWTSVWTREPNGWKRHVFQNTYVNSNADRCPTPSRSGE